MTRPRTSPPAREGPRTPSRSRSRTSRRRSRSTSASSRSRPPGSASPPAVEALIDSQVLAVGATEEFSGEKRYRLDLIGGGSVKLKAGRRRAEARADRQRQLRGRRRWHSRGRVRGARLPVSVRAGIVVTGTEVLTGRVVDRNGPWVSERLGELGCEVADIVCVADRPEDLRGALEFLRTAGLDLIVTTGGPRPDRRRPHRGDRRRLRGPGAGPRRGDGDGGSRRSSPASHGG